jgi:hypothetical protein
MSGLLSVDEFKTIKVLSEFRRSISLNSEVRTCEKFAASNLQLFHFNDQ